MSSTACHHSNNYHQYDLFIFVCACACARARVCVCVCVCPREEHRFSTKFPVLRISGLNFALHLGTGERACMNID